MKKIIFLMVPFILLIFGITNLVSCGKEKEIALDYTSTENPFSEETSTKILGKQSHGFMKHLDDFEYITYSGQEIEIEYFVELEGISNNIGFLLFVNGKPQPYKIKNRIQNYEYLHSFNVDNGREEFTFQFDVTSGQKDEIADLAIVSIYNPEFKPDMIETT
ncbi:hypothetical protein [Fusibacter bizertensis]